MQSGFNQWSMTHGVRAFGRGQIKPLAKTDPKSLDLTMPSLTPGEEDSGDAFVSSLGLGSPKGGLSGGFIPLESTAQNPFLKDFTPFHCDQLI